MKTAEELGVIFDEVNGALLAIAVQRVIPPEEIERLNAMWSKRENSRRKRWKTDSLIFKLSGRWRNRSYTSYRARFRHN